MKNRFWLMLTIFIVSSLACNLGAAVNNKKQAGQPTQSPTQPAAVSPAAVQGGAGSDNAVQPVPTRSSQPAGQPALADQLDVSTLAPAPFGSYSQIVHLTYLGEDASGSPLTQTISITIKTQDQPERGQSMLLIGNKGAEVQTVESVSLGGTSYTDMGVKGCVTSSENSSMDSLLNGLDRPDNNLKNKVTRVEQDVVVNGVHTDRYALAKDNYAIENAGSPVPLQGIVLDEGSLYVARQGNYVVRMEFSGHVTGDGLNLPAEFPKDKSVKVNLVFDVAEAPDRTWNLAIPAACQELASTGAGYPLMDDAANLTQIQGQVMYSTRHTPDEVIEFYRKEMPAQGWKAAGESIVTGFSTLKFTRDGVTVGVNILGSGNTQTAVTIIPLE